MKQQDVIALAKEAGFKTGAVDIADGDTLPFITSHMPTFTVELGRFAAIVEARTREECRRRGH